EGELLGGECSYYACIPSKALLRPPAVADTAAHLPGITTPQVDRDALLLRRDVWVSHYDDSGQVDWAEGAGIQVVRGHGRIVGEREVLVEAADGTDGAGGTDGPGGTNGPGGAGEAAARTRIRARRAVVIATGSRAHVPGPLRELLPWTSRDVTGVREVPGELVIVGGGVVAGEAATWVAALGAQVRLLVRGCSLLTGYEPFAAAHVQEALAARGVTVQLGASVVAGEREGAEETGLGRIHGGRITLQVEDADGRRTVSCDELLAATGRRPR